MEEFQIEPSNHIPKYKKTHSMIRRIMPVIAATAIVGSCINIEGPVKPRSTPTPSQTPTYIPVGTTAPFNIYTPIPSTVPVGTATPFNTPTPTPSLVPVGTTAPFNTPTPRPSPTPVDPSST